MAIVRYTAGRELTPEKETEIRARIRAVAKIPDFCELLLCVKNISNK